MSRAGARAHSPGVARARSRDRRVLLQLWSNVGCSCSPSSCPFWSPPLQCLVPSPQTHFLVYNPLPALHGVPVSPPSSLGLRTTPIISAPLSVPAETHQHTSSHPPVSDRSCSLGNGSHRAEGARARVLVEIFRSAIILLSYFMAGNLKGRGYRQSSIRSHQPDKA